MVTGVMHTHTHIVATTRGGIVCYVCARLQIIRNAWPHSSADNGRHRDDDDGVVTRADRVNVINGNIIVTRAHT